MKHVLSQSKIRAVTAALALVALGTALFAFSLAQNQDKPKMKVEIWSDVACPFCYIGKRKFEAALAQFSHSDQVEVVWKSFILNPDVKTDASRGYYESLAEAKGWSPEYARQAGSNVTRMAASTGLQYNMDSAIMANTLRAHCLLQAAKAAGRGSELKEALLRAHFIEGLNVDDLAVLTRLGQNAGLSDAQVSAGLNDETYLQAVQSDLREAREIGVTGVPFFVFNRQTAVSGAQESSTFLRELERAHSTFTGQ